MTEITTNETLEVNHRLSYRAKVRMAEFNRIATTMEEKMRQRGIKRVGNAAKLTYKGNPAGLRHLFKIQPKVVLPSKMDSCNRTLQSK